MSPVRAGLFSAIVSVALWPLSACRQDGAARLSALDPSERAAAIVAAAEAGDASAIHRLVELLDDRDMGVRMYANLALLRLVGADYGYHYYDPEPLREQAVDRWRAALREGRVTVRSSAERGAAEGTGAAAPISAAADHAATGAEPR